MRAACLLAVSLTALGATASGIHSLLPWPNKHSLQDKLDYFEAHKDDFDAIYVGSSQVLYSLVPAHIDAALERRGLAFSSFNFGALGMDAWATEALLNDILAMQPKRLRWVVLEWRPYLLSEYGEADPVTDRERRWHRLPIVTELLSGLVTHPLNSVPWASVRRHTKGLLSAWGNVGEGPALLAHWNDQGSARQREALELLEQGRGHQPRWRDVLQEDKKRAEFLGDGTEYGQQLEQLVARNSATGSVPSMVTRGLERQRLLFSSAGVERIPLILPEMLARPMAFHLAAKGELPGLLAFNRPRAYPALYELTARSDPTHLGRQGANLMGTLMAQALAKVIVDR